MLLLEQAPKHNRLTVREIRPWKSMPLSVALAAKRIALDYI
jgi:hypothetical protein